MVGYNRVNVKLPDSQLNKLKSALKNNQGTTLRISECLMRIIYLLNCY